MEYESNEIDKIRSGHLLNVHAKGGDALQKTVVMEMNRKLSIN